MSESQATTTTNQVAVIENSIEILKTGPQILQSNQERQQKALAVGRNILTSIQEKGMDAELDEKAKNYLIKVNDATKEMKEKRASVTQIMDELKKMYTVVENELDPKKAGTIPAQIQTARDEYAKQQAEEAERKRKEAERQAAITKAKIEFKADAEVKLNAYFNDYLLSQKQKFTAKFNSLVLDSFADDAHAIRKYEPNYSQQHFEAFTIGNTSSLITAEAFSEILSEVKEGKYELFAARYKEEMTATKNDIVDKLPSKHAELQEQRRLEIEAAEAKRKAEEEERKRQEEMAKANEVERARLELEAEKARAAEAERQAALKAEQERLEAERKKREQEEADKLAAEAAEAQRKAEEDALIKKQGEETMAMFEKEAAIAEAAPSPETRQGFEINVLHPVGYTQIFALWFEKVGKDLPVDKIGNTKLDQMKAWAEKEAHKSGTKIESKFLKYEETFKAVNRKAK